ncbi:hypothetical protein WN944_006159 [Citrus x changshan-huyou]|uniref:O-methyltransferase dimerisation domain-containing protein n=1 Tax=Citrus x changshan-huyou TaxID=2935761 RepID=A0AAP0QSZ2_9ROSI
MSMFAAKPLELGGSPSNSDRGICPPALLWPLKVFGWTSAMRRGAVGFSAEKEMAECWRGFRLVGTYTGKGKGLGLARLAWRLVWSYTYNYMKSLSLKRAIQLRIPDIINNSGQPMTLTQIIVALNVHPNKTRCTQILVCLLAHSGFFVQQKDGKNEQEEESILLPPHLDFFSRISLQLQGSTILLLIADATFTTSFHFLSTWLQNDDQTLFGTADG